VKQLTIIISFISLLVTTSCNASWLVFHKPEFKGKIVDIETNEPIDGVAVVAIYRKQEIGPGDSANIDITAQEALTDKNGEFTIPSYTTFISPLSWSNPVYFYIFKPGYLCIGPIELEEEFSGSGKLDWDFKSRWNKELKYRLLKSGVIMLPKVAGKDRIESFRSFYLNTDINSKHPIASSMKLNESKYILTIE